MIPTGPIVSLVYRVAPERRGDLLAFLGRAVPFYERPGGIRVGLYESADDPGLFLELVAYVSEDAYAADQERVEKDPEMRAVLAEWRRLTADPPVVRRMRPVEIALPVPPIRPATMEEIERIWRSRWGVPIVGVARLYGPRDVEGLALGDGPDGLVTWFAAGDSAEIVTLDALVMGRGHGGRLLAAAEEELRRRGARVLRTVTSNDNVRALAFYLRHGYRIVRVHAGAMDRVRAVKPAIPAVAVNGLPIRDLLELEKP